jgi:peptidoglycan-associated lipoprotein
MRMTNTSQHAIRVLATTATLALLGGCATENFVRETVAPVQSQVGALQERATTTEGSVKALDGRTSAAETGLKTIEGRVASVEERTAALNQDAVNRARDAQKGTGSSQFLMSKVLEDDRVKFTSGRAAVTGDGGSELNNLFAKLKAEGQPVFLEIQGHTDSRGSTELNQRLGQARAEAVRLHLARAGMPLHRMSTISYGESAPLADNTSAQGRSQNRRVHLVVLR